jgi:ribosomal RNA assembly protein
MIEIVRIPEDRKSALIGRKGCVKERIQKSTNTKIEVTDVIEISGDDPILVIKARDIVTAIGRGFPPDEASRLLGDECLLHVISLEGESEKKRQRLFARVIGREGKVRKRIEEQTGASICIRGKTLSLIGKHEEIAPAEEAIEMLLAGKTHAYAFRRMYMRKASA